MEQNERDIAKALSGVQESLARVETTLELTKDHPLRIRLLEQAQAKSSWIHNIFTATLTAAMTAIVVTMVQVALSRSTL